MNLQKIENLIFRKVAPHTIRHLNRPDLKTKDSLAKNVLDQIGREFQIAPPFTLHLASPKLLAGMWSAARESLIVNASKRAMREAAAAAVSGLNECPYCVDVHNPMVSVARGNAGENMASSDAAINAAADWASATLNPKADILHNHRIAPEDVVQVFGTAICFHYINRMVNIFLDKSPVPMPGGSTSFSRTMSRASLGFFGKRIVALDGRPGEFITETETSDLPAEFAWARSNLHVAGGFQRFAAAAEKAGEASVHNEVRLLIEDHLDGWQGEAPALSRHWVEDLITGLSENLKPSARLALLAARASWQVDDNVIKGFRSVHPDDKSLIETAGWASFVAVRRISSWIAAANAKEADRVTSIKNIA